MPAPRDNKGRTGRKRKWIGDTDTLCRKVSNGTIHLADAIRRVQYSSLAFTVGSCSRCCESLLYFMNVSCVIFLELFSSTEIPHSESHQGARIFFYLRDVVSAVYATATWLGGWLGVCPSYASIVSKRLNLS